MTAKERVTLQDIEKEIIKNWKVKNGFLGIKRLPLENLSPQKNWKVRKAIALMRKQKIIFLNLRNYFVNMEKLR
jgi:hypothetical protein